MNDNRRFGKEKNNRSERRPERRADRFAERTAPVEEVESMELWVAMDGQRLAAALNILYPGLERENYGYDLDFDRDQLMKVVNMDTAVVDSGYRGRGLQRQLLERAESELRGRGETFLLCTIHPANSFSLNNALKAGYEIRKTQPKYGSIRHILCKKIF